MIHPGWIFGALFVFVLLGVVATYMRSVEWEKYRAANNCSALAHREYESGGTPKTRHTIYETQWRCDGAGTFWRED